MTIWLDAIKIEIIGVAKAVTVSISIPNGLGVDLGITVIAILGRGKLTSSRGAVGAAGSSLSG